MMKKNYMKPNMKVTVMKQRRHLLAGSPGGEGGPDNTTGSRYFDLDDEE